MSLAPERILDEGEGPIKVKEKYVKTHHKRFSSLSGNGRGGGGGDTHDSSAWNKHEHLCVDIALTDSQ